MQLQVRLVHAEPGQRVVEVTAYRQGETLGSALGEAQTAEEAEDRARARLAKQLAPAIPAAVAVPIAKAGPGSAPDPMPPAAPAAAQAAATASPANPPAVAAAAAERPQEPEPDPEDWSSELAQIDLQLGRLSWQREQEGVYLERAFGHPSRSRLTAYADLQSYLQALTALPAGSDPTRAAVPLRRRDLLAQCDLLLGQLGWDAQQGRHCLDQLFGLSSRQHLNDTQLLEFNMQLEEKLLAAKPSAGAGQASPAT
ncbi:hypothetical protein IQ216_11700 [Cyanobium sp. LEGE 06143]|uniref:hypothetical protein n=1 Tax=Cyanobium sp. LEGE 06143 TaxID=945727 RepID=UPI001882BBB5|nr:hypothetical protein [Cyanobium sp. LEGE 06143]MBE9173708.1 hypothetical protein [Cyanobium sp. LEGE 06143]